MEKYYPVNELYHFGVLGMKWGVRRYQNPDGSLIPAGMNRYSSEQKRRDRDVYGRVAANRIEKRVNAGHSVSGARSLEAQRISNVRKTAMVTGRGAGAVAGFGLALFGSKAIRKAVNKATSYKFDSLLGDSSISPFVDVGLSAVGGSLASIGTQSIAMLLGGYSPSKYR